MGSLMDHSTDQNAASSALVEDQPASKRMPTGAAVVHRRSQIPNDQPVSGKYRCPIFNIKAPLDQAAAPRVFARVDQGQIETDFRMGRRITNRRRALAKALRCDQNQHAHGNQCVARKAINKVDPQEPSIDHQPSHKMSSFPEFRQREPGLSPASGKRKRKSCGKTERHQLDDQPARQRGQASDLSRDVPCQRPQGP